MYKHRDMCREGKVPSWDGWEDGDGEKWVGMYKHRDMCRELRQGTLMGWVGRWGRREVGRNVQTQRHV